MARAKKIKLPKGSKELQVIKEKKPHFDYVNSNYAKEHYGKYLIVKYQKSSNSSHNRLYLCSDSAFEFMRLYLSSCLLKAKKQTGRGHILTTYPEYKDLVMDILFKLIKTGNSQSSASATIIGLSRVIKIWKKDGCIPSNINKIEVKHYESVHNEIREHEYIYSKIVKITYFLRKFSEYSNKIFPNINLIQYSKINKIKDTDISMAVQYQLDYYAKKDIEHTINYFNEYQQWMRELDKIGDLFSLSNLFKSYEINVKLLGKASSSVNRVFIKIGKVLHGVDIVCWKYRVKNDIRYENEVDKHRHASLIKLAKSGIDITMRDERMFAMWLKRVCPEYPFNRKFSEQFTGIWTALLKDWKSANLKKIGIKAAEFDLRVMLTRHQIYSFYLFFLIRSGLNQDVLKDVEAYEDTDGNLRIGIDAGAGILIDGYKGRGNTQQSAIIRKGQEEERYLKFLAYWLTNLIKYSSDRHIFQYLTDPSTQHGSMPCIFSSSTLSSMKKSNNKDLFFRKYKIIDEVLQEDGKYKQVRIRWISHQEIRKMVNFSRYLEGLTEWERQHSLGHSSLNTQIQYQQTSSWKHIDSHRIATVQNLLVGFFKGNITTEDNEKLRVFETPLGGCSDPYNPTYKGIIELGEDEICTNWRKCLTECDKCNVVPEIHGPVIYAWYDCMEQMQDEFLKIDDWEKEFIEDFKAAELVLNLFKEDVLEVCKLSYSRYSTYVRNMIFNTQKKRKMKRV